MAVHVVQSGDTWASIALAHDVVQAELTAANGVDASTALYPGQVVVVPSARVRPKPSAKKPKADAVDDGS